MKGGPKLSLRLFLHRALHYFIISSWCSTSYLKDELFLSAWVPRTRFQNLPLSVLGKPCLMD